MPLPLLAGLGLAGLGGLAGLFGKPNEQTTNSTSDQNTQQLLNTIQNLTGSSTQSGMARSTPNLSPAAQQFLNTLIGRYSASTAPVNLAPYQAQQSQAINRRAELQRQSAANIMASRGLATSPVSAATEANIDTDRFRSLTDLSNSIPLMQYQMNQQNLNQAGNFMSMLPALFGVTNATAQSGTTNQRAVGQQSGTSDVHQTGYQHTEGSAGGGLGGMFGGLGAILASLYGGGGK